MKTLRLMSREHAMDQYVDAEKLAVFDMCEAAGVSYGDPRDVWDDLRNYDVEELRAQEDDDAAFRLVDAHEQIVIDLSNSVEVVSRWLKLFHRMAIRARSAGKQVFLVGASKSIREMADFLALEGSWETSDTVDLVLSMGHH